MAETPGNSVQFEDLLENTGWGLYYKFVMGMVSACSFTQGALLATFTFSMALYGCDSGYTQSDMLAIYISFLIGMLVLGSGSAFLCDRCGRKKFMCYSLITCFLISFVMAFSYHYYVFAFAIALLGTGIEVNTTSSKILLAEILPKRSRGRCLLLPDLFWTLGYLTMASYAIFTQNGSIPSEKATELKLTNWRIMYAICGGLGLFIGCACALLEESPRYFLHVQKNYLAFLVLKQFYAINKSSYAGNFEVKENEVQGIIDVYDQPLVEEHNYDCIGHFFVLCIIQSVRAIFSKKRFLRPLLILILVKIPILTMSMSTLTINLERQLSTNTTGYEATLYRGVQLVYPSTNKNNQTLCDINVCSMNFFIVGSSILLGQLVAISLIDTIGRKPLIYSGYLVCCICYMSLTLVQTHVLRLVNSSILMVGVSCLISSISVVNIECFPTALRGAAHGITNFFGYTSAILFVVFINISYRNLNIALGIVYFGISLFCIFLPELKKQPMVE